MPKRVLVTGASGFLGRHIVARLLESGYGVRGQVRDPLALVPDGCERAAVSDLSSRESLAQAVRGCDAVVHLAGRAHVFGRAAEGEYERVNVHGTAMLLRACREAGVRRLVFMSTAAVAGRSGQAIDEMVVAPMNAYGVSKLRAEELVDTAVADGRMSAVVLRPPLVYGPGMKGNPLRLLHLVARGVPLPVENVRNRRSVLFVGNLVDVVERALTVRIEGRETFCVADEEAPSTPDLVRIIAAALGRSPRLFRLPAPILAMAPRVARQIGMSGAAESLERLLESFVIDSARVRRKGLVASGRSLTEGWKATADWYLGRHVHSGPDDGESLPRLAIPYT